MTKKPKLTDEQAVQQFVWLTTSAGNELQQLAGGASHAPVFDRPLTSYLRVVAETANALADYGDQPEAEEPEPEPVKVEEPKAKKADEKAEKAHESKSEHS